MSLYGVLSTTQLPQVPLRYTLAIYTGMPKKNLGRTMLTLFLPWGGGGGAVILTPQLHFLKYLYNY